MISIDLKGFAELETKLREFGPKVTASGIRTSAYAGASIVRGAAKTYVPVDTGALRESISVFRRRTSGPNVATYAVGLRDVKKRKTKTVVKAPFYGRFVELGTSKMRARPFLRPAIYNNVEKVIDAMKSRMAKAIETAARKV